MVTTAAEDPVSRTFAALADPTRRAILERLARGDLTVNEVAEPFEMSLQAVSKHLKVLEAAGLVTRGRHAQWRPVRLDPTGLDAIAGWLSEHQAMRIAQFDQLAQVLARMSPPAQPPARDGSLGNHSARTKVAPIRPELGAPRDLTLPDRSQGSVPSTKES